MRTIAIWLIVIAIIGLVWLAANAQTSDSDSLFGTFNTSSTRIKLATDSDAIPVGFQTQTFNYTNGPTGETSYKNRTWGISYNSNLAGTKVVSGEVHFGLSHEPKYCNGSPCAANSFMSEIYYNWGSPDASVDVRPWGFNVEHANGNVTSSQHGKMYFKRNVSNGGGVWGIWYDDGFMDLRTAPAGRFAFKNNTSGILWGNGAGTNTIMPLFVDNFDQVQIGGWQTNTVINSANLVYTTAIKRGGTQILGTQCSAIANSDGTQADDTRAINAVLSCLRSHGIVAP